MNEVTLFTSCERWSQGVKQVGEIHWQAAQRWAVLRKKGGADPGTVQKWFPDGNMKSSWGRQKGKDKLRGH